LWVQASTESGLAAPAATANSLWVQASTESGLAAPAATANSLWVQACRFEKERLAEQEPLRPKEGKEGGEENPKT
jgi:hypothetical protein